MIKLFVFDTNSLISAHLLPNSVNRKAFDKAIEFGLLVHSAATLMEFTEVFVRPKFDKYLSIEARLKAIALLRKHSQEISVSIRVDDCRDSKDNKFLELSLTAKVDALITGDKDLLVLNPYQQIPIISPADFITWDEFA